MFENFRRERIIDKEKPKVSSKNWRNAIYASPKYLCVTDVQLQLAFLLQKPN